MYIFGILGVKKNQRIFHEVIELKRMESIKH